ncbi:8-oxo-dGTP pyrophosphatase MutT, NUDIX family [Tranquillimonas rosea]|uniref:8-oxo-dGTP pyrophosphatase MutT, NUDIX family n=1 Tax=Tranquillimonas rosea TaxID=641238 RepID=A0A1H9WRS2_9RHOB|nr:NUDIX hydrolase [Tranquillimonas rosea]SES36367.1 8-oxo-dGTP pyrophosphatase MutT, NUDIX family [Tranquillimonas rosea]
MSGLLQKTWTEFLRPLLRRPERFQVAALCYRQRKDGPEVLVISSRDTGRWLLPKGWPMDGQDAAGAATIEAWEEAGVKPRRVDRKALGTYRYDKRLEGGVPVPTVTKVFAIEVARLTDDFPQRDERSRKWVRPAEAAEMVDEPELRTILKRFGATRRPDHRRA